MLFKIEKKENKVGEAPARDAQKRKSFGSRAMTNKIRFLINKDVEELDKSIGTLEMGETYCYITNGAWSATDLICYVCSQMGSVDSLIVSSWALSDQAVKTLKDLVDLKVIKELKMLLDVMTKQTSFEAVTALEGFAKVSFAQNHSKVFLAKNEELGLYFTGIGSGNLSRNNRVESGFIIANKQITEDYIAAYERLLEHGNLNTE